MYSEKNVRTIMSSEENIWESSVWTDDYSPVQIFRKNIEFVNEQCKNESFEQDKVLLTVYPLDETTNVGIITCRDITCLNEDKLFMYLASEKEAKEISSKIQKAIDNDDEMSYEQLMRCLANSKDSETEEVIADGIDPNLGIEALITEEFDKNFTEEETHEFMSQAYEFFLENKDKAKQAEYEIFNTTKNSQEFGVLIMYDRNEINQVMLGTYRQVSDMIKNILEKHNEGFSITQSNTRNFLERCDLRKKLRKKKRDDRRRKRR